MLKNKSSLYRIYRPAVFEDIAGHQHVVEILKKELATNSFSHAFLFAGQKGTGKTSIARIFAKAVNCQNLSGGEPCENCENCQLANSGRMPDIYEIDAASNNGVDEIRNIKNNVSTLPLKGKYKIYIIDEVHMLSKGAFNALLKTLEEPPLHALFILATTEFAKIPQTIVSRCQTFNFKKIDKKSLIERLNYIVKKEEFVLDGDVAEEIYFLSDGSLRDALNILEQLMIINDHQISLVSLKKIFYVASKKEKLKIITDVLNNDAQDLINYFENAENQGMDFDVFALSLIEILKEIIEFKLTKNPNFLKFLTLDEVETLTGNLEQYFFLADQLSETYAKTKGTNVSFNYILISLLKAIKNPNEFNQQPVQQTQKNPTLIVDQEVENEPIVLAETKNDKNSQMFDWLVQKDSELNESPDLQVSEKETLTSFDSNSSTKQTEPVVENVSSLIEKKLQLISQFLNKKYMIIENNDVFNLLVAADKKRRDLIEKKIENWFQINDQQDFQNPQLANEFIAFYGAKVSAASDCEVLIRFETEPGANFLKKVLMDKKYQKRLQEMLGMNVVFYVIDDDQWETIKKEYLFKKKSNNLPVHQHINDLNFYKTAVIKEKKQDKTEEFLEKANELFGDDIEIGD